MKLKTEYMELELTKREMYMHFILCFRKELLTKDKIKKVKGLLQQLDDEDMKELKEKIVEECFDYEKFKKIIVETLE